VAAFTRLTGFVKERGAVPGVQLAHAGRKASTHRTWDGGGPLATGEGAWQTLGPSPVAFSDLHPAPEELSQEGIAEVVGQFAAAARRALAAGFQVAEIHGAHGYLIGQFLSPHSNRRTDGYGGPFENRIRFALEVVDAVREVWPGELPLFFRVSATDGLTEGGWTPEETVRFAKELLVRGVDLLDVSSGGNAAGVRIPTGPGYQVHFAAQVKAQTELPVATVGEITDPRQAETVLATGQADAVLLGRELLRRPTWVLDAARELGAWQNAPVPAQYHRAYPHPAR
jgi:2,4-dienoyl-CoA reductase-like NADH-dependent reductase (Old Yellow Enzyme family)